MIILRNIELGTHSLQRSKLTLQSRERFHLAEANRCRAHAKASNDDDQRDSGNERYSEDSEPAPETGKRVRKSRLCPHAACYGQPGYGSRLALRRHVLQRMFSSPFNLRVPTNA